MLRSFYENVSDEALIQAFDLLFGEYIKEVKSYPTLAADKRPDLRRIAREMRRRRIGNDRGWTGKFSAF